MVKYVRQILIIFTAAFLGELLRRLLPLPVPANIYGFTLLFGALCFRVVKPEHVHETAAILIELMPLLLVAPAAAILPHFGALMPVLAQFLATVTISTAVIFGAAGRVTQYVIRRERRRGK